MGEDKQRIKEEFFNIIYQYPDELNIRPVSASVKTARTTMYHATRMQNRKRIMAEGLLASKDESGKLWENSPEGNYFWDTPEQASRYAQRSVMMSDPDIWAVDVTGLNLKEDPYFSDLQGGWTPSRLVDLRNR